VNRQRRKYLIYFIVCLLLTIAITPRLLTLIGFPKQFQIIQGHQQLLNINFPFDVYIRTHHNKKITINGQEVDRDYFKVNLGQPLAIKSMALGKVNLEFNLFGIIPIRKAVVNVIPQVKVYPGGQSIGVILKSKGVVVVKESYVLGADNKKYYPAKMAGIEVGDKIVAINSQEVKGKESLAKLINYYGSRQKELKIKIKREGNVIYKEIKPKKNKFGRYMIGLYIDDGTTGVGTLSFYDPYSKRYGALGHMITDPNSRSRITISEGKIVQAKISGIHQGSSGIPGEKLGTFFNNQDIIGRIEKNSRFGIYGRLTGSLNNRFFPEPIPVATALQVKEGPAKIYTVVHGGEIEEFDVRIERVFKQYQPKEKGLIIKITDYDLLKRTGGIIQGMSGSPIVQNGRLVGAVTHVFIDDSARGYGVLAEWMVKTAGVVKTHMARRLGN